MGDTRISDDSPNWFKLHNFKQYSDINDALIKNNESLHVFSRFQKWITITPDKQNRNKPLENVKLTSLESSAIIPYWMQIKPKVKANDIFKPIRIHDTSLRGKGEMLLIDKDQTNLRIPLMQSNFRHSKLY